MQEIQMGDYLIIANAEGRCYAPSSQDPKKSEIVSNPFLVGCLGRVVEASPYTNGGENIAVDLLMYPPTTSSEPFIAGLYVGDTLSIGMPGDKIEEIGSIDNIVSFFDEIRKGTKAFEYLTAKGVDLYGKHFTLEQLQQKAIEDYERLMQFHPSAEDIEIMGFLARDYPGGDNPNKVRDGEELMGYLKWLDHFEAISRTTNFMVK